ncbi:hypothetical protein H6F42_03620 [Pseudanabaena sp. FACHB-1998]|uniref:hypothetical protein n=1 Tax=Pseudanabaena sp. FACHB-1998 TaxID=2692858 RepID=UPI0016809269|nr:hypothetical protein [Pseudanabaena sp. FACHB-1998]MBD2176008.1 hypothetical protein [Pseudanabaena sp. FACHB-1998]
MSVPAKISELVDRFQQNASEYRSATYNETQAKNDFIDPFFETLGWDIRKPHHWLLFPHKLNDGKAVLISQD